MRQSENDRQQHHLDFDYRADRAGSLVELPVLRLFKKRLDILVSPRRLHLDVWRNHAAETSFPGVPNRTTPESKAPEDCALRGFFLPSWHIKPRRLCQCALRGVG